LENIVAIQILGSVEDEHTFSTFSFMESKLRNRLCEHFATIMGMFSQPFFTLEKFPYDATFEEWKKAKVRQLEV
jgi:hypothetical protein